MQQAIRPAVVNRKAWGGNHPPAGAQAQSILMSVRGTCAGQRRDALSFVSRLLRGQSPRLLLAPCLTARQTCLTPPTGWPSTR